MDCKKIAEIYLRSCRENPARNYKFINKKLQLKSEIVYELTDKNCLESGLAFITYCNKEIKSYEEMKKYYNEMKNN